MNRGLWYGSLVLLILGLSALIVGMILAQYDREKEILKGRATARVVELKQREGEGPYRSRYYPVFEFYAAGQLRKVIYPIGSFPSKFSIGQEVRLYYDTEDPEVYRIADNDFRKKLPWILSSAGAAALFLAVIIFIRFAVRAS